MRSKKSLFVGLAWSTAIAVGICAAWSVLAPRLAPSFILRNSGWTSERIDAAWTLKLRLEELPTSGSNASDLRADLTFALRDPFLPIRRIAQDGLHSFHDRRDGKHYPYILAGKLAWMAQNLAYSRNNTWSPGGSSGEGAFHGLLYTWQQALTSCPDGWRLPSAEEWSDLVAQAGSRPGRALKSDDRKWYGRRAPRWDGNDSMGFHALPSGAFNPRSELMVGFDREALFWTSTPSPSLPSEAIALGLATGSDSAKRSNRRVDFGMSVRCVIDPARLDSMSSAPSERSSADPTDPFLDTTMVPMAIRTPTHARSPLDSGARKPETGGESAATPPTSTSQLVDSRDGAKYRTVEIGSSEWMAENIRYPTPESWCYEDASENCRMYGRLYDWQHAKQACPSGWHLPSDREWGTAIAILSKSGASIRSAAWEGTSNAGLNILPAGGRDESGTFQSLGQTGYFWTATEKGSDQAVFRALFTNQALPASNTYSKSSGFSVRCVKNAGASP
ncbi:MAG TPA: FISUMP domain-containing protein [Fibrobacteria bacterium]|nr:FISUMP domain-containing protein [Fibrobacteria bacterium]